MRWRGLLGGALTAYAACASVAEGQGRSLHWRAIDVDARLDADGRLHVRERQAIVFTGDWNGGERTFDVRWNQRLVMGPLLRIDSVTGAEIPLHAGSTAPVDGYTWSPKSHVLRWRSRRPSAPPFANTEIDYVLQYTYEGVLVEDGDGYRLDHDFAFANRSGTIDRFTVRLTLDRVWRAPPSFTGAYEAHGLLPGRGYVVTAPLAYAGTGRPTSVVRGAPRWLRLSLAASMAALVVLLVARLLERERALGRFAPLTPGDQIDEAWLKENVFHLLPEVVGAAWDETTAAPEVAAVLARLVAEKKLASKLTRAGGGFVGRDVLHLELLVERFEFNDYERKLIDALFAPGDRTTDTDMVRQRYRKTGFDPAGKIRAPLEAIVKTLTRPGATAPKPRKAAAALLFVSAVVFMALAVATRPGDARILVPAWGIAIGLYLFSVIAAAIWQKRIEGFVRGALWFIVPVAVLLGGLAWVLLWNELLAGAWTVGALSALVAAFTTSVSHQAASSEGAEQIAFRKRLASARRYFAAQLGEREPRLHDDWYPYLIAFGLGPRMDRWFRAFGVAGGSSSGIAGSSMSTGSSSNGGWTGFGGGGGFSGGGASGSWTSAVGAIAAGVASPSSGGSGGGGGGGGSSGGGGGGGW